jgi:hypothetical protein
MLHSRSSSALLEILAVSLAVPTRPHARTSGNQRSQGLTPLNDDPRTSVPRSRACRSPVTGLAPGAGRPTPAPQFRSQAFSTSQRFAQVQVSGPCFVPQPLGIFLLQRFPLAAIVVASRRHQLPCSWSPAPPGESARALSPTVSATPPESSRVLPLSPADYEAPFRAFGLALNRRPFERPLQRFPVPPGSGDLSRRLGLASSASKPCSSCESVRTTQGCP